eukprot:6519268-Heterocapsa_arctica.AAC.1
MASGPYRTLLQCPPAEIPGILLAMPFLHRSTCVPLQVANFLTTQTWSWGSGNGGGESEDFPEPPRG